MNYKGKPVSLGYGIGKVLLFFNKPVEVEHRMIQAEQTDDALNKYETAKQEVKKEIKAIRDSMKAGGDNKAEILEAHLAVLDDPALEEGVHEAIVKEHKNVIWAISEICERYIGIMEKSGNTVFRERAADVKDIRERLLYACVGRKRNRPDMLKEPCIIVCHELLPLDIAGMDREHILAIVTEAGGDTSHSAIMARNYEIPAVIGVEHITEYVKEEQKIIVDAVEGLVLTEFDAACKEQYEEKAEAYRNAAAEIRQYRFIKPETKDGTKIEVMLNLSSVEEACDEANSCADGVGLLRTEFLYMENNHMPTEEEQFKAYKDVLSAFGDRPVVLRTLDIGGDKTLSCFPVEKEENPFMGERAIRLCFAHPEILTIQLRAALRASVYGNLWIMFPMIGSIEDIRRAKAEVEKVKAALREEEIDYSDNIKIGIMIEIPSIAVLADMAAGEVDFASIGSNDLIQYTMAADRMNRRVTAYCQNLNPAVLRLIAHVVNAFTKAGKSICLCGELAGEPISALLLAGFGMRKLSMNLSSVAKVKKLISNITLEQAQKAAEAVLNMATQEEIITYLTNNFRELL